VSHWIAQEGRTWPTCCTLNPRLSQSTPVAGLHQTDAHDVTELTRTTMTYFVCVIPARRADSLLRPHAVRATARVSWEGRVFALGNFNERGTSRHLLPPAGRCHVCLKAFLLPCHAACAQSTLYTYSASVPSCKSCAGGHGHEVINCRRLSSRGKV
jgi:hypothetical protein